MKRERKFETEAEMVAAYVAEVERLNGLTHLRDPGRSIWTVYAETCGWDLLLVDQYGVQIGIEAKLSVNAKVISQALPNLTWEQAGPDYRAILVPQSGLQLDMSAIAGHLGLTIIRVGGYWNGARFHVQAGPHLPEESGSSYSLRDWHPWLPIERHVLPDYIPDVQGGKPAPVALTPWKVRAIKLLIILERRGWVTRADMKHLDISPTRWTARNGYLDMDAERGRYVRGRHTPDLKSQHPENWPQIEADYEKWAPKP